MQQYIVYAQDGEDGLALKRRLDARPIHLAKARELKANGNFITGGALLNDAGLMRGSMMVVQFETKEQLQQWLESEPYINEKVWQKIEIHPFRMADV